MAYDLIKEFEDFRAKPYRCSAKTPTIGYGTTVYPSWYYPYGGLKVTMKDQHINTEVAAEFLEDYVLANIRPVLKNYVKMPLNTNQEEALTSFIYNVGPGGFKTSTLLEKLNVGDYSGVAEELLKWDKVTDKKTGEKKSILGLTRRREAERKLFLTSPYKSIKPKEEEPTLGFFEWVKNFFN